MCWQSNSQIRTLLCDYCDLDDTAAAPLFLAWMVGSCVTLARPV
jgi:hypothetical protein